MKYLFYIVVVLCLFYYLTEPKEEDIVVPEYTNPAPDPSRIPHHYDWNQRRYIYEDEIPPDTIAHKHKPMVASPDSYVKILPENTRERETPLGDVILNGKRYRQRKLANGDIQLILIR